MAPSQTQCAAPVASMVRQSQSLSNSAQDMEWPPELDMLFEKTLAKYAEETGQKRWQKVASVLPNKSPDDVLRRYELLVDDIDKIEMGLLPLPDYSDDDLSLQMDMSMNGVHRNLGVMMASPCVGPMNGMRMDGVSIGMPMTELELGGDMMGGDGNLAAGGNRGGAIRTKNKVPGHAPPKSSSEQERKKGIPWSEEEHRLFLLGLQKFGKGDWRSISRNYVISRTPTQVASHAQKYFIRLNSMNKDKRRASIHDITSLGNAVDMSGMPAPQQPQQGMHGRPMAAPGAMGHMAAGHHPGQMQGMQQGNANGAAIGLPATVPTQGPMQGMSVGYLPQSQPQMMVQWKAPQ
eukprot:jgi/Mesvir1/6233/Mv00911-RA.1